MGHSLENTYIPIWVHTVQANLLLIFRPSLQNILPQLFPWGTPSMFSSTKIILFISTRLLPSEKLSGNAAFLYLQCLCLINVGEGGWLMCNQDAARQLNCFHAAYSKWKTLPLETAQWAHPCWLAGLQHLSTMTESSPFLPLLGSLWDEHGESCLQELRQICSAQFHLL